MEPLIVVAVPFVLCWLLFILPRQRQVRAHEALVDALQVGDEVVLSAGIFGRIVELGPERLRLEVAPEVELWVARRAVLRRAEAADASVEDAAVGHGGDAVPDSGPGGDGTGS